MRNGFSYMQSVGEVHIVMGARIIGADYSPGSGVKVRDDECGKQQVHQRKMLTLAAFLRNSSYQEGSAHHQCHFPPISAHHRSQEFSATTSRRVFTLLCILVSRPSRFSSETYAPTHPPPQQGLPLCRQRPLKHKEVWYQISAQGPSQIAFLAAMVTCIPSLGTIAPQYNWFALLACLE